MRPRAIFTAAVSLLLLLGPAGAAADGAYSTPPETTITGGPDGATKTGHPTFDFTSSEPGSSFACQVDSDPFVLCQPPFTIPQTTEGPHAFFVTAIDPWGNVDPTPAQRNFRVDRNVEGANASARRSQRPSRRAIVQVVVTAAENVTVTAAGKVATGKGKLALVSRPVAVVGGTEGTLIVRPTKRTAARRLTRLLRRRKPLEATLAATFTDELGNRATTGRIAVWLKGR